MATATQQKLLGAFYTSDPVARFLVRWAVRTSHDRVLDPSCGDGVFLAAAADRLQALGNSCPVVYGFDVDPIAVRRTKTTLPSANVVMRNFFKLDSTIVPPYAAVVGNPPFVRYQTFNGDNRHAALECAQRAGVKLPQLSSSWAPFLVHAAEVVGDGGRLAMVVPAELAHAQYALEVLRFLTRRFANVSVCMFQQKLFPNLSEDTFLLLAEGKGSPCSRFTVSVFEDISRVEFESNSSIRVNVEDLISGRVRLTHYLLGPKVRHLYQSLSEQDGISRFGDVADIGIGYVTGANDYFHLSERERRVWNISRRHLRPAVISLSGFQGLVLKTSDWRQRARSEEKVYLFAPLSKSERELPSGIRRYLSRGIHLSIPQRFKCRVRTPWFQVPHVRIGDALLSYMAGNSPKLVLNQSKCVAPNTLHLVRFKKDQTPSLFVAGWYSSLSRLSCEIEGHPLGGGMLKLEPSEAERVLIAQPLKRDCPRLFMEINHLLRLRQFERVRDLVDQKILRKRFALSGNECARLRDAANHLESWRMHR